MPSVEHTAIVNVSLPLLWDFIKDMSNWAPFLEGYQKHQEINEKESLWTLRGDVGVLSRVVDMKVTITEWIDLEKVAFKIVGITEKANGEGTFLASHGDEPNTTKLFFQLKLNAGGLIGPVVNVLIKPMMKPVAEKMATGIKEAVEKQHALT